MGKWTKIFADGTELVGTDVDVKRRKVSWRNSESKGIVRVTLDHQKLKLIIDGLGEYWQSDTYESEFPSGKTTLVKRRIMKKIGPTDTIVCIRKTSTSVALHFESFQPRPGEKTVIVNEALVGQWVVAEMDLLQKGAYSYIAPDKF